MAGAAILDFQNFKFLTAGTLKRAKLRHHTILSKSLKPRPRYDFSILKDDGRRHLGFLNF